MLFFLVTREQTMKNFSSMKETLGSVLTAALDEKQGRQADVVNACKACLDEMIIQEIVRLEMLEENIKAGKELQGWSTVVADWNTHDHLVADKTESYTSELQVFASGLTLLRLVYPGNSAIAEKHSVSRIVFDYNQINELGKYCAEKLRDMGWRNIGMNLQGFNQFQPAQCYYITDQGDIKFGSEAGTIIAEHVNRNNYW